MEPVMHGVVKDSIHEVGINEEDNPFTIAIAIAIAKLLVSSR